MQRAWLVLLVGCGFQSGAATTGNPMDASGTDVSPDAPFCSTITGTLHAKACPTSLAEMIDISDTSMATTLDTTAGATNPQGLDCAPLGSGGTVDVCALEAKAIRIEAGTTLAVHGNRALALFAHTIDIEGTIDVASHIGGSQGPGSDPTSCNQGTGLMHAKGDGGGQGGTFDRSGGDGGDSGNGAMDKGGQSASTVNITELYGGCPGWESGNGNGSGPGTGGHGGGAVWIAVDTGTLTIGALAVINASGASGVGGIAMPGKRGGFGGGSGGLIVLQASQSANLVLDPSAKIFANGGHGGGGAGSGAGSAGTDPNGPASSGGGGEAGTSNGGNPGAGGAGFPTLGNGAKGSNGAMGNGGGGGGGGAGAIRLVPSRTINDPAHVSPAPAPP